MADYPPGFAAFLRSAKAATYAAQGDQASVTPALPDSKQLEFRDGSFLYSQPTWILDGNYSGTLAERIEACDTIVFLDVSRFVCVWRVLKRLAMYRGETRPELPPGCPERFNVEFLLWIWNYPNRTRRKVLALLETHQATKHVVHLRSRGAVERFVSAQRRELQRDARTTDDE